MAGSRKPVCCAGMEGKRGVGVNGMGQRERKPAAIRFLGSVSMCAGMEGKRGRGVGWFGGEKGRGRGGVEKRGWGEGKGRRGARVEKAI